MRRRLSRALKKPRRSHPLSLSTICETMKNPASKSSRTRTLEGFNSGDNVEVSINEEGFEDSYYEARIVAQILEKNYAIVRYKTLLKDDSSGPLREIVAAEEVRPPPPKIPVTEWSVNDKVDAFDNDGWWVGKITGRDGDKYNVYFQHSQAEIAYEFDSLRVHQDWVNGKWVNRNKKS